MESSEIMCRTPKPEKREDGEYSKEKAVLISLRPLTPMFHPLERICLFLSNETFGRSLNNRTVVPHVGISRSHCEFLQRSDGSWAVKDSSMCGIKINGAVIPKQQYFNLYNSDILRFDAQGEFTYIFKVIEHDNTIPTSSTDHNVENGMQIVRDDFEYSQNFERTHMETKLHEIDKKYDAVVHERRSLQIEHRNNLVRLESVFRKQVQDLKGSLEDIEAQKAELVLKAEKEKEALETKLRETIHTLESKIDSFVSEKEKLAEDNKNLLERLQSERETFEKRLAEVTSFKEEKVESLQKQLEEKDQSITEEKEAMEKKFFENIQNLKNNMELELKDFQTRALSEVTEKSKEIEDLQNRIKMHEGSLNENLAKEKENQALIDDMKTKLRSLKWEKDEELSRYAKKYEALEKAKKEAEDELTRRFNTELKTIMEKIKNSEEFKTKCVLLKEKLEQEMQSTKFLQDKLKDMEEKNKRKRTRSESERESQNIFDTQKFTDEFNKILEPEVVCAICSDIFIDPVTLNCGHSYCSYCINHWNEKSRECPSCRCTITSKIHSIVLNSLVATMVSKLDVSVKNQREETINLRKQTLPESKPAICRKRNIVIDLTVSGTTQSTDRQTRTTYRPRRRRRRY